MKPLDEHMEDGMETKLPIYSVAISAETSPRQFIHYAGACALSYADAKYISHAANAYPKLVEALREIRKGEGAFSRDPLTHASNTIESMKEIAKTLLRELGEDA